MAVAMDDSSRVQLRELVVRRLREQLAEQHGLLAQHYRRLVVGEELMQLLAKDRSAAWLQHHDACPRFNLCSQAVENALQIDLCRIKKPKIVKRTPAAQMPLRNIHLITCVLQNVNRSLCRFGK